MRAFSASALGATAMAVLTACSSGGASKQGAPGAQDNQGDASAATGGGNDHALNPDGFPYPNPADGYGSRQRLGNRPGSVMRNFKFLGYPNADKSHGLQTIALADYYDPCGKRLALLHVTVAGVWCPPCNAETDAVVAAKAQLATQRVVVIQALSDGPRQNVPATQNDLNYWVQSHKANFTMMLDPGLQNFGGFFDAALIPWNCDLDPRTMEILDASTGWAGDIDSELQQGLASVAKAPGYPVTAACH
jgi:AhpC/TSA family